MKVDIESRIPDYCMPLVGYRRWSNIYYGTSFSGEGQLYPIFARNYSSWLPKEIAKAHQKPSSLPSNIALGYYPCGLHAGKELELVSLMDNTPFEVWGEVWLWGEVVEHEMGYRAEFAYPKRIITTKYRIDQDSEVAKLYGIPIITLAKFRKEKRKERYHEYWIATKNYLRRALAVARTFATAKFSRTRGNTCAGEKAREGT